MDGGKTAYCGQNTILLLHGRQTVYFSWYDFFYCEELAFYRDRVNRGLCSSLVFCHEQNQGQQWAEPLHRQLFTPAAQVNCGSRVQPSLHGEGWKLCIPAQHMFRDSFFLCLSGFVLPALTSSRLLLCLKHHLAASSLSSLQRPCFDVPHQSASRAHRGRGLSFHLLVRWLVKSSRDTLCSLSLQSKTHIVLSGHRRLVQGSSGSPGTHSWGSSPLMSEASPTNVAGYKIILLIVGKLLKIKQSLPVWWSSTPFNLPQKCQFSHLTISVRRNYLLRATSCSCSPAHPSQHLCQTEEDKESATSLYWYFLV